MDSDRLDLNHLLTFRVFADEGTVRGAARILGRSQPAISARLRLLREALGVDLVTRNGRRLVLTPTGRRVYEHAALIEGQTRTLLDEVRSTEAGGTVRIGVLPTIGVFVASKLIAKMRLEHPGVRFELESSLVPQLMPRLGAGELDLVVGVGRPPRAPHLEVGSVRPVRVSRVSLPTDAPDTAWIAYGHVDDDFFAAVETYLEAHDLVRHVAVRVTHIETIKHLVLEGVGTAILPDYTVRDARFRTDPVPELALRQPVWVAFRQTRAEMPFVQPWVEGLRAHFREE